MTVAVVAVDRIPMACYNDTDLHSLSKNLANDSTPVAVDVRVAAVAVAGRGEPDLMDSAWVDRNRLAGNLLRAELELLAVLHEDIDIDSRNFDRMDYLDPLSDMRCRIVQLDSTDKVAFVLE